MARENFVLLYGQIQGNPRVYCKSDGSLSKAMMILKVLRRYYISEKHQGNKLYYDHPIIMTQNAELIQEIAKYKDGDMIELRGALTTKEVIKSTTCPKCGSKNSKAGNLVYVTPIYLCRREEQVSPENGIELLKQNNEVSNLIMIIGTLCRDPDFFQDGTEFASAQYELAVNRKYRIREDAMDVKTDYPWVKTYGAQAFHDSKALHTGSVVYINGGLQTREVDRETECSCGTVYRWKDNATEIVPYSIEYLANCDVPEGEEGQADEQN